MKQNNHYIRISPEAKRVLDLLCVDKNKQQLDMLDEIMFSYLDKISLRKSLDCIIDKLTKKQRGIK